MSDSRSEMNIDPARPWADAATVPLADIAAVAETVQAHAVPIDPEEAGLEAALIHADELDHRGMPAAAEAVRSLVDRVRGLKLEILFREDWHAWFEDGLRSDNVSRAKINRAREWADYVASK